LPTYSLLEDELEEAVPVPGADVDDELGALPLSDEAGLSALPPFDSPDLDGPFELFLLP
jgi:hypothetical protein